MADVKVLEILGRSDEEIKQAAQDDTPTLKRALGIETYARSFRLHHGLVTSSSPTATVCLENLMGVLGRRCSMYQLASEYPESMKTVMVAASDLAKAALFCVADAYASAVRHNGELEDRLNAIVPYLPLWADNKPFTEPFRHLVTCCRRVSDDKPIDLAIVESALHALKESCDACGELLAAVSPVSATTWDCTQTQFPWTGRPVAYSFTPPDTPKLQSPLSLRPKAHSLPSGSVVRMAAGGTKPIAMPPGKETVKLAFESVPILSEFHGTTFEMLPSGVMAALNDVELATSAGTFSSSDDGSDGSVSPGHQHHTMWRPVLNYPGMGEQYGYSEENWAGPVMRNDVYGTRQEKQCLQWKERPVGFRVVMCRHMDSKGKCKKAGTCTFAHSQEDLEQFRSLFIPTERCNYGAKCLYRNKDCHYSHTPGEQHRSIKYYNVAVARACTNVA